MRSTFAFALVERVFIKGKPHDAGFVYRKNCNTLANTTQISKVLLLCLCAPNFGGVEDILVKLVPIK